MVTGATGFIGAHVLPELVLRGYEVAALALPGEAVPSGVPASWHRADLLEEGEPERVVGEIAPSHLLHLAWEATPGTYWHAPENLQWVTASEDLFETFAEQGGVRAVGTGTCAEYDWSITTPYTERETPCRTDSAYSRCKHDLFQQLSGRLESGSLSFAWARPFFIFGPGEPVARLVPQVVRGLLKDEPVACSEGRQIRDFIYVKDLAGAFAALLDSEVTGPVNLATGVGISVRELVTAFSQQLGRQELVRFGARPGAKSEPPTVVADTGRLRREVGYSQATPLQEAVEETIAWWRAQQEAG